MREARIIVPTENAMHMVALIKLKQAIVLTFGGLTLSNGFGYWTSPKGDQEHEMVAIIDVAYEPSKANDAKLFDLAWQFREDANQVEVYLRYGNGHVQMVQELSCMNNGEFDWEALAASIGRQSEDLADIPSEPEHVELTAVEEDQVARAVRG